jgi:Zn-dependent alcohol dehydrogenase
VTRTVRVLPLISHRFALAEVKQAFDLVAAQKGVKLVVETDR